MLIWKNGRPNWSSAAHFPAFITKVSTSDNPLPPVNIIQIPVSSKKNEHWKAWAATFDVLGKLGQQLWCLGKPACSWIQTLSSSPLDKKHLVCFLSSSLGKVPFLCCRVSELYFQFSNGLTSSTSHSSQYVQNIVFQLEFDTATAFFSAAEEVCSMMLKMVSNKPTNFWIRRLLFLIWSAYRLSCTV